MQVTYVLAGHYEGKTVELAGHKFKSGRLAVEMQGSQADGFSKLMSFWQAYPEGSKELAAAQGLHAKSKEEKDDGSEVHDQEGSDDSTVGEGEPTSEEGANGEGHAEVEAPGAGVQNSDAGGREEAPVVDEKLQAILSALDHANDEHWTMAGLPRLSVVEEAYGSTNLTRGDIQAAMPGWDREAAAARAKELAEI